VFVIVATMVMHFAPRIQIKLCAIAETLQDLRDFARIQARPVAYDAIDADRLIRKNSPGRFSQLADPKP